MTPADTLRARGVRRSESFRQDGGMDWQRLGKAVVARRVKLGFPTREKFAQHAAMSSRLLSDLENGRRNSYDRSTLVKLERALGWVDGSVDRVLEGDDPATEVASDAEKTGSVAGRVAPAIWLSDLNPPSLADLSPHVREALESQAHTLRSRLEHDLNRITLNLRSYAEQGFEPVNDAEARMLVYQASPERAREKAWRLVVAMADLDQLFLGMPPGPSPRLADFPWSQVSESPGRPLLVIPLFTSRERLADYDSELLPVAASPRDLVEALPETVSALNVNPGGPLSFTITDTSLRDSVALADGKVELDPDVLD